METHGSKNIGEVATPPSLLSEAKTVLEPGRAHVLCPRQRRVRAKYIVRYILWWVKHKMVVADMPTGAT